MKFWRQPGFWLPLLIVVFWGGAVLALRQDTVRETAFTLMMAVALASSLNILLGYTGYVSFGHIVFFGLGGYTGFFLLSEQGWPLHLAALGSGSHHLGPWGSAACKASFKGRLACFASRSM